MRLLDYKIKILVILLVVFTVSSVGFSTKKAEALDIGSVTSDLLKTIGGDSVGGDVIKIVSDTSATAVTTALQNTLARVFDGISSQQLESINLKEMVLDPIAWNMGKELQKQMTGEVLKWVGGQLPGQNGKPPFVQIYSDFYTDVKAEVAMDVTFGSELTGLCSEKEEFDIRQQTYQAYIKSRSNQEIFSCTDQSSADSENGNLLEQMFRGTVACDGVSVCAGYKAEHHLALRQANAVTNEKQTLDYSRGMLPQKVCREVDDGNGVPRQVCEIVNPLFLAADNLSFQLTEVPSLQLLGMDEFSEIVSDFMTSLTNEAVTGISSLASGVDFTGVLGLSGNPGYTNLLFGSDGGLSYVDSLINDQPPSNTGNDSNPIYDSLVSELQNLSMQTYIFNEVSALKNKTEENKILFGTCYDLELTAELTKALNDATSNIQVSSTSVAILTTLNEQYTNAQNASIANSVMSVYIKYRNQGIFRTQQQNLELQTTFIDYTFKVMVEQFKYAIATEQESCGGEFDYGDTPAQERDPTSGSSV